MTYSATAHYPKELACLLICHGYHEGCDTVGVLRMYLLAEVGPNQNNHSITLTKTVILTDTVFWQFKSSVRKGIMNEIVKDTG